jgi:hypothetical protein
MLCGKGKEPSKKQELVGRPKGGRGRGRPKKTWKRIVLEERGRNGKTWS